MDKKDNQKAKKDRFYDDDALLKVMNEELKKVIETYRHAKLSLVVWKDGKVAEVDPNDIEKSA